jgi:hypothetical protein
MQGHEHWPYRAVVLQLAQQICERLTRRLIRKCQGEARGVGPDNLRNLWEEICLAMRSDHPMCEAYRQRMLDHLAPMVAALPMVEQQVLWLMVNDEEDSELAFPSKHPERWPIDTGRIARHVCAVDVMYECANYDNARIRACEGR